MLASRGWRSLARLMAKREKRTLYLAPPFIVENYQPLALEAFKSGQLKNNHLSAQEHLKDCRLCPRDCGVDRSKDLKGACNTGRFAIVSSAFPHYGEESVLQGKSTFSHANNYGIYLIMVNY